MSFQSQIKGGITQTLIKTLLEDVGYKVVPLGVEELIREVKSLRPKDYLKLQISENLRCLPDFFITDREIKTHWLVEVKYRKIWNIRTQREIGRTIIEQVRAWQPLYLVLFLGRPIKTRSSNPSDSIRVAKLVIEEDELICIGEMSNGKIYKKRWDEIEWSNLRRIQDVFKDLEYGWQDSTLIQSLEILKSLNFIF